jgi:predicted nucleotidyltransferase
MVRNAAADVSIADALFGRARQAVLALLFGQPDRAFYTREIIGAARVGASAIQNELEQLTRAGLLLREPRGNQVHYRANRRAPIFPELSGIVTKTFGIADVLRKVLAPLADAIDLAFVYGSIARGQATAGSDIDVFVVTSLDLTDLDRVLDGAEKKLGRKVSPTVMERSELEQRIARRDHFVSTVLAQPMIHLAGDQSIAERKRARRPRPAAA